MGKKKGGKKKGKKSGGGGKKGKGGEREDQMTVREAVMALDIQRKERAVEDLMYEIKGLDEKNKRHQGRNERLKEEQEIHIKNLIRQAKEVEAARDESRSYSCTDVELAMREVWARQKLEEEEIYNLGVSIDKTDRDYQEMFQQVEMWRAYRDVGAKHHSDQIKLLQFDLESMNKNFDNHCTHLQRQLDISKNEITAEMEECMQEQKHEASERAMQLMDTNGVQEIHENEWLKTEAEIHRKEVANIRKIVENLELENIRLISELVDCQVEDLKIHRNFADVSFEKENDDNDVMNMKALSIYAPDYKSPTGTPSRAITSGIERRPKSALLQAIEDKIFSIETSHSDDESFEEEEEDEHILEQQKYLHLGPLELKLLCVAGEQKPIHPIDSRIQVVSGRTADTTVTRPVWPISSTMLQSVQESK